MENTQEMFILSKYKYIRYLAQKVTKEKIVKLPQATNAITNMAPITKPMTTSNLPTGGNPELPKEGKANKEKSNAKSAEEDAKEKRKADKLAKQEMMKKMCQPSKKKEEKVKFVEKTKYVNETPVGEKKDMSKPMLNAYDPTYVESAWDAWWTKQKYFQVDVEAAKKVPRDKRFIMLLPPPNVTGSLHLGHTLMGAIEDSITRWRRMKGFVSLWVPGTDHAGIATQSVVEKKLFKEEGKYRSDYSREEFLQKVWEWKNEYGNRIFEQFRRIGVGFDLSRNFFTMDDDRSAAVREAFVQLHDRGILYRAERMVHWCCALKTAISDVEIEDLELEGPTMLTVPLHSGKYEFGVLIDFAYKIKSDPTKEIIVSTTRIETMLGDVAVAVHPEDTRYKHLIGECLIHPFFPEREIKIVGDSVLVNMEFGTGAVKITPGHDPNDFLCGQRHSLPSINIFTDDGLLNNFGGPFEGMKRYDCRNKILSTLDGMGLLRDKRPNKMVLQRCSKTQDIIEPLVKPQWWVNCKSVAARAIEDVNSGALKILPEFQKRTLFEFLENIRDWCVSRQLWWGHRCPAFLVKIAGVIDHPLNGENKHWVAAKSYEEALEKASVKYNCPDKSKITLTQDEDVLDTWFSSALLPFSVFGWPDVDAEELKYLFPTDLLETGHDIIFFWVARMIFMSYFFMDTLPFHTVFLHPIVRDAKGRKMSKSLGNVIDPLEVIDGCSLEVLIKKIESGNLPKHEVEESKEEKKKEFPEGIPECGADALRLGLMSYLVQGRNINLNVSRIVSYRFFGNKLWQATKFSLNYLEKEFTLINEIEKSDQLLFIDRWILNKLSRVAMNYDKSFENYNFGDATSAIYAFWMDCLCPVYIEAVKPVLNDANNPNRNVTKNVLLKCIMSGLQMLHPLMPFITEELYQRLPKDKSAPESICISSFPEDFSWINDEVEAQGNTILDITHHVLSLLTNFKVDKKVKPRICIYSDNKQILELVKKEKTLISTLANSGEVLTICDKSDSLVKGWQASVLDSHTDVFLDIKQLIDVKKEVERLNASLKEREKYVADLESKINKPDYETKVPESIRVQNAEKVTKAKVEIEKIVESIKSFQSMDN